MSQDKERVFQMSQSQVISTPSTDRTLGDPCPVCLIHYPEPGNIYCSKACRVIAYNFRKRIYLEAAFLKKLGFETSFCSGVQLLTKIPQSIQYAYPAECHFFYWPTAEHDLKTVNADTYWRELTAHLGGVVGPFTLWLFERGYYHGPDLLAVFEAMVKTTFHDQGCIFKCANCNREFIRSDVSFLAEWWSKNRMCYCADCVTNSPPF